MVMLGLLAGCACAARAEQLERLRYNHPGLEVDLGVGLWALPLPMDYDGDGDLDLVVDCPDAPYNGVYLFENPGGERKLPVFKPPVRLDRGMQNLTVSYVDGTPRVLSPGVEYVNFQKNGLGKPNKLPAPDNVHSAKVRANQWKYTDWDDDGRLDLIVGVGDWSEYGWDDAFDSQGRWKRGPLHGYVYLLRNTGASDAPKYEAARKLAAGDAVIDVYGWPSPNLADFDGDGDDDLLCGEFVDKFTYFENIGTRSEPRYAAGRRLTHGNLADGGQPIEMDLEMIVPVAIDWDRDGDVDLVVGQEDGRVALVEHTGKTENGVPQFLPPVFFRQQADEVKFGALVTPFSYDWDGDGDEDLLCGNTAGYIGLIENLDGGNPPRWAEPRYLEAGGETLRVMAGENGSIQGPCESKWGYTTLSVADWDGDALPDLVVNSIWGKVVWYRNAGPLKNPALEAARPIEVAWEGATPKPAWNWWSPKNGELATQWRTTPLALDYTGDGLCDLVMLDHEGFLCLFERQRDGDKLVLSRPRRVFEGRGACGFDQRQNVKDKGDGLLQLNVGTAGASGRRKFCFADWNGDGRLDLLVNSTNVNFLKNVGPTSSGGAVFEDAGPVSEHRLAGHTTSPTVVDWNKDGRPDLLIGAEDGRFYYLPNPAANGEKE
jgi:hypothetical protein